MIAPNVLSAADSQARCRSQETHRIGRICSAATRAPTTLCYLRCTTAMGLSVAPRGLGDQAGMAAFNELSAPMLTIDDVPQPAAAWGTG